jgi:hypothetical protein
MLRYDYGGRVPSQVMETDCAVGEFPYKSQSISAYCASDVLSDVLMFWITLAHDRIMGLFVD